MSTPCSLWHNAQLASMVPGQTAYGLIPDGAVAFSGGDIAWVGPSKEIPADIKASAASVVDCQGRLLTPGLIDCHTHLVYAGHRANEFERRLLGESYQQIAESGGGIAATVAATRAASTESLYAESEARLLNLMREGVTTVEIKSGYGLNLDDELKMLRVARELAARQALRVRTSFLGAHALPAEFTTDAEEYIDFVCDTVLPAVAAENLADAVDGFCEQIAFTPVQIGRVFEAAKAAGLDMKLHAEQLSDSKGAVLAAAYGALSVDHLEYLSAADVPILKAKGTVAVLLPAAFYYLRETQLPPIAALREHQVPMAVASDSNPGSAPVESLLLMLNMACTLFGLTAEETLAGVTCNAAAALGLQDRIGTIEAGKAADLVLWDVKEPSELSYRIGANRCLRVVYNGVER